MADIGKDSIARMGRQLKHMSDSGYIRCSECHAMNEPRAAFCSRCGSSLRADKQRGRGPLLQRFSPTSLAVGAALLLALLIAAIVLYTLVARSLNTSEDVVSYAGQEGIPATVSTLPPETTAATDETGAEVDPATEGDQTTTTTLPLILVRPKSAVSSSALPGTATASYQAPNLVDGDLSTSWVEDADGPGVEEWVRFEFAHPVALARIDIANGLQKEGTSFTTNPRVKLVSVEYSSGASQLVELHDVQDFQMIVPTSEAVEWVRLVIVSVYPGDQNETTALSEVRLYEATD